MIFVVLGAVGTIGGAGLFVAAFRRGQAGDHDTERRLFRAAVAGFGVGSAMFVIALMAAGGSAT
ncbi:hypothetical protein OEB99_05890 [Actinotalea sp. M2MS4P-6]|uniref:hypothetical protein n=1 Tax=Actinotalea sp. M2MS4P-6 TaxID=2983762 RepID=UPI0021E4F429|nr:hypothetical protein [Actinotalea sp. M2MS4P-6]MCV2393833.1 hypothetical protein [Actinotalea sp. M2MS4P-6]